MPEDDLNDDRHDNFFINPDAGRFPAVEEEEAPLLKLLGDSA
jgi:D-lyxose ketol-isomerase